MSVWGLDCRHAIHLQRHIVSYRIILLHTRMHCRRILPTEAQMVVITIRSTHECQALDLIFKQ